MSAKHVFDALFAQLQTHCRIRLHAGKPRVWNASGREPPNIRALGSGSDPVWPCDRSLPAAQRGITILGAPLGDPVASAPCQTGQPVASHPYHPRPPVPDLSCYSCFALPLAVATSFARCPLA